MYFFFDLTSRRLIGTASSTEAAPPNAIIKQDTVLNFIDEYIEIQEDPLNQFEWFLSDDNTSVTRQTMTVAPPADD